MRLYDHRVVFGTVGDARLECACGIQRIMNAIKRMIAAVELLLVAPAVLFMTALVVRSLQPLGYEPALTAERIVTWYALRPHLGLWVLLIALPLAALIIGCGTLIRGWNDDAELRQASLQTAAAVRSHLATLLIAAATLMAAIVLAIVAVHAFMG